MTMLSISRDLTPERTAASREIDRLAGVARTRYVTDAPAQMEIYRSKEQEAREFQSDAIIGPFLTAEMTASGRAPEDIAAEWMALSALWRQKAAQIEQVRIAGKTAVTAATSPAAIKSALATAKADLSTI